MTSFRKAFVATIIMAAIGCALSSPAGARTPNMPDGPAVQVQFQILRSFGAPGGGEYDFDATPNCRELRQEAVDANLIRRSGVHFAVGDCGNNRLYGPAGIVALGILIGVV